MAVETQTNPRSNLPNVYTNVTARELDFVSRFTQRWDALRDILGIMRPIKKAPGTQLVTYTASVTLASGEVDPGCVIPYSQHTITKAGLEDLTIEKYAHAVTIEEVSKYGAEIAIEKSDDAFLNELQNNVLTRFYAFLNTGSLDVEARTFQDALAKAKGAVIDKFNKMRKSLTSVVGFCNVLDAYDYLGAANITTQTQFGLTYLKDFMGYNTLFLLSVPDIPRGTVIALPTDNIDLYYIDPDDSEFNKLGLSYVTDGETNLIGFHAQGNYNTAVGETYALMGMKLWAEYLDGIAVVEIDANPFDRLTITPADQSASYWGKTVSSFQGDDIQINGTAITGTLKDFGGWPSGTLKGRGHFLALKFDDIPQTATSVEVGIVPSSTGMGLQALDADKDAVFKISDKNRQNLQVDVVGANGKRTTTLYDLTGLTLE